MFLIIIFYVTGSIATLLVCIDAAKYEKRHPLWPIEFVIFASFFVLMSWVGFLFLKSGGWRE